MNDSSSTIETLAQLIEEVAKQAESPTCRSAPTTL